MANNKPRIAWNNNLFKNPSFEGEGSLSIIPLSWSKLGDGNDASTLTKESGARESELGFFRAESEVLGTDTEVDNFQEIAIPVTEITIGHKYLLSCWVKTTGAMDGRIRIATQTGADADIDSAEQTFSYGVAQDWIFVKTELTITTLASYDHFRITIRNESTGAVLYIDDVVFGRILDFPVATNNIGTTNIQNIKQVQYEPIDNFSASGVAESIRIGRPDFTFDIAVLSFRQVFYDDLFDFFKYARNGKKFAFFLDSDSGDLKDFHYPYCMLTSFDWSPELLVGIVRYNIEFNCRTILPFELA